MNKVQKTFLIGLAVLVVLVPLGLLASGTAFGEWSSDDLKKEIGYVPAGVASGEETWKAPLPDYAFQSQKEGFFHSSIGYYFSAIIGITILAGIMIVLGSLLSKKGRRPKRGDS